MKLLVPFVLMFMSTAAATAQNVQSLAAIDAAVRNHVVGTVDAANDVEIVIGRLDPRLRLPACNQPLDTRFAHGRRASGPQSIEVRCTGRKPWSLYVSVDIARFAEVVIAARPIPRSHVIGEDDLARARRKLAPGRTAYVSDAARITGQLATRFIPAGQPLSTEHVERPHLVKRGQRVILASGTKAISVRVSGTALEDGAAGERITVRNSSSERVIEGVVSEHRFVVVRTGAAL